MTPLTQSLLNLLSLIPVDVYTTATLGGCANNAKIDIQGPTQHIVKRIRKALPVHFWHKTHSNSADWWEYTATFEGVTIRIYACKEAPKTCHQVIEEFIVTRQVPVRFEERMVSKMIPVAYENQEIVETRKVWKCE